VTLMACCLRSPLQVVRKGQTLDRDDTKASASGALIDVQLVARIKCKVGTRSCSRDCSQC
jgi:hypothetical protein